jgi:hypothetical protein
VRISDLGQLAGEHGFVDVEALDFCVFALTLLYSLHRVTADQVIDMLGGFMCRTDPEEGM